MSGFQVPMVYDKARVADYCADVESFQRRETRRARRISRGLLLYSVASSAIVVLLSVSLAAALPLTKVLPVFLWARPDGTVDHAISDASLPGTLSEAQRRAWAWEYTRLREGYSWPDVHDNYERVNAMSAPPVGAAYSKWFNNEMPGNPSPTKWLGKDGTIRLKLRESELAGDDGVVIRFCRTVERDGRPPETMPFVVRLHYGRLARVPLLQRVTFNSSALVVTSYPGPEQEGTGTTAVGDCGP